MISYPTIDNFIYGGNTTCAQILYKNHLIIFDTGFGVSNLGETLMPRILGQKEFLNIHIFYSNFNWDHVQGLTFFHPIYFPTSTINIYSPSPAEQTFKHLDVLFDGSYSPFEGILNMPSSIKFHQLKNALEIDELKIEFQELDHQNNAPENNNVPTYAYKASSSEGGSVVIATNHEARKNDLNDKLIKFSKKTDLLIHDAQFTEAEYQKNQNFGHSSMESALLNAKDCEAQRTLLTHHSPFRKDTEIQELYLSLKKQERFNELDFKFAREDIVYPVKKK